MSGAKSIHDYIRRPDSDDYDAYAVWSQRSGEFILCGRPSQLRLSHPNVVVLCTVTERMRQFASGRTS
jgi:hypothetical protein